MAMKIDEIAAFYDAALADRQSKIVTPTSVSEVYFTTKNKLVNETYVLAAHGQVTHTPNISEYILKLHEYKLSPYNTLAMLCKVAFDVDIQKPYTVGGADVNHKMYIADLSIKMPRLIVHKPSERVSAIVNDTKIEGLPSECPKLLTTPFLVESKMPMVGDIIGIGGHLDKGRLACIVITTEAYFTCYLDLDWGADNLDSLVSNGVLETSNGFPYNPNQSEEARFNNTIKSAMKYIISLALLLDAKNSPCDVGNIESPYPSQHKGIQQHRGKPKKWSKRNINLSRSYKQTKQDYDEVHVSTPLNKDGMIKASGMVQGFLRNQPYGPGRLMRKQIYVNGFARSFWTTDKPLVISIR